MPHLDAHITRADKNQELIDHCRGDSELFSKYPEWVATIAFYKAVHLIEALFFVDYVNHKHSNSHDDRKKTLRGTKKYSHIYKHYRPLYSISMIARYLTDATGTYPNFSVYMPPAKVQSVILDHYLVQVENSVRKLINSHA